MLFGSAYAKINQQYSKLYALQMALYLSWPADKVMLIMNFTSIPDLGFDNLSIFQTNILGRELHSYRWCWILRQRSL